MISVMNDFEIDRNPTSDPDLSFFGMESPIKEDEGSDPMEADEASPPLDLTIEPEEIEEEERPRALSPAPPLHLLPPEKPPTAADVSGLVTGDMVWGRVKSHPWWPGHIFNESFASPSVRRTKRGDFVLVAFFGDSSYGWFDLSELIPFEPNFVEKSKQTTARSFVWAVEESIDEASRRAALGLSCRCRNHYNFRPTRVPNYFEVDVVGYERNGIYSKSQIDRERRSFEPSEALGFLRQLAVTPKEKKTGDVEWYRNVALVLALRRHMFVEFDPTYAQAFGLQPVEPARDEKGVREQAESFAPRVAPLTGPLVYAESLGIKRKSFNQHSASTSKSSSSSLKKNKKNKYLLKRRDDHPAATANSSSSLPDPYFTQKQQQQQPATPPFVLAGAPVGSSDTDYVLQRRDQAGDGKLPRTPPLPVSDDSMDIEPAAADGAAFRKEKKKLKKRSLDDLNNREEAKLKMKRKRSEGLGQDFPSLFKKQAVMPSAEIEAEFTAESSVAPPPPSPRPVMPVLADVELGPLDQIEMPTVLADLRALALDPFYGVECQVPLKVLHLLLRFRNQFYSKSLLIESDAQAPAPMVAAAAAAASVVPPWRKEPKEQQQQQREQASSSSKPAKLLKRPDDPTNAGLKRPPSDRQEEMSTKRSMKVNQVKSLASEKKAALTQKPSPDGPKGMAAVAGPSTAEPARRSEKQELVPMPPPPPPPSGNPAFVLMKFPPKSTLPSVANLKARFARFGSLEVDSIRVYWKSHSCRVKFGHHSDAVRAMQHVESNEVFGPKVDYSVREVEAPVPVVQPEPPRWHSEPQGNGAGSSSGVQLRSGEQQQVVVQQPVQPQGRLKSILKKPGDDAGKESQRVKFMLSGNVNGGGSSSSSSSKRSSPPPSASSTVGFADVPPPRAPPLKSASFQLPLPPPPQPRQNTLQPPLPPPPRSYEPRQQQQLPLLPPPPLRPFESRAPMPPVQLSELPPPLPPQQQQPSVQRPQQRGEGRERDDEDISHQMLSLLMRCNDIVNNLRSLPGFSLYRPL